MKQYQSVKSRHPESVLLFRMGDFYETFEEDARITARVLGITLTKRGNGAAGEVPLAGFPHHALETYLPKLVRAGYRVAICEQLEDPKKAKGIVKRDVIEVVSPGVAFSETVLDKKDNNFICGLAFPQTEDGAMGCAWIDVSTGEFYVTEADQGTIRNHLLGLRPSELVVRKADNDAATRLLGTGFSGFRTRLDDWIFHRDYGYELFLNHFRTKSLKGFGVESFGPGIIAAGGVFHYINESQRSNVPHIRALVPVDLSRTMALDASTKRNLEILSTLAGDVTGSLFSVIDDTRTPMGGRMLRSWVHQPLKDIEAIVERQEQVAAMLADGRQRTEMQETFGRIGDLERMLARSSTGRSGPRELVALRDALDIIADVRGLAGTVQGAAGEMLGRLHTLDDVRDQIRRAIVDDPPATVAAGGAVRDGYRPELDEVRGLSRGAKEWIAKLQVSERSRTGITSLKIGYNSVFGYYIEVTNAHKAKVPGDYIRKQTLTTAERYITPALKEYEEKVAHAEEKIQALETAIIAEVQAMIVVHAAQVQENARIIALLDCVAGLAAVAEKNHYVRPTVDDGTLIDIRQGRHPVIERLLPPGEAYQPNDCILNTDGPSMLIITGPNMSGKSSYLRQVGLIVLLAQIGSSVPAASAHIGLVDRIFTRVGASDNIAEGESTFLVEMQEAANIVHAATRRSLILLDEVGRGTSTFDGISIAWALSEYIHTRVGARTLFATHYHELNRLEQLLPGAKNVKVDVREYGDKVVFLHTVVDGYADHSYGIHVAQMAGLPREVTDRANEILRNLESSDLVVHRASADRVPADTSQLGLFEVKDDRLRDEIRMLDIQSMTPVQALQVLDELKRRIEKEEKRPPEA